MSVADQHDPSKQDAASSQQPEGEKRPTYAVVPPAERATEDELYAFRTSLDKAQPDPETQPQTHRSIPFANLALLAVALVCAVALFFAIPMLLKPKPPAHFIDMGNRRFDPAGLGGRLIARWEDSATYQLSIDPLEPQELDGFHAVAVDPPHPLSVVIRLKDSAGLVACQREILLPAPELANDTDHARVLLAGKTPGGDTVQYVVGADGKLAEIALSGPLSCPADVYRRFEGWDFTSDFPTVAGQYEWLRHENALEEARKPHPAAGAGAWGAVVQHLPAPIEGDDVITGDNSKRGTVDTSAGRVFLIVKTGAGYRAPEWQIFPAAIHFRCDKNGVCVLSRANTRTTLQARLLK
jgi:hypothetical protein